ADSSVGPHVPEKLDQIEKLTHPIVGLAIGIKARTIQPLIVETQHPDRNFSARVLVLHAAEGIACRAVVPNKHKMFVRIIKARMSEKRLLDVIAVPGPGIAILLYRKTCLLAPGRVVRFVITFAIAEFA